LSNTAAVSFLLPRPAFTDVFVRFSHCSVFFNRTPAQRIGKPHFAASDLLELVIMLNKNANTSLALRPRDAARALGISPRLLWQLTHDRRIPFVRVGRAILYPVPDLQEWLNRQAKETEGGRHHA
jgi:excisionase family DNA binding protein